MNLIFRIFLAFNSTSFLLVVFWIKSKTTMNFTPLCLVNVPNYVSYILYILITLVLTYLSLLLSKYLSDDEILSGDITSVGYANDAFLPSYLGYFFVALDVPDFETFYFIYPIILAFTFLSQTLYFNPVFLIFGYHFYNFTTVNNVRLFVITRKKVKDPKTLNFKELKRINDHTFIDNKN